MLLQRSTWKYICKVSVVLVTVKIWNRYFRKSEKIYTDVFWNNCIFKCHLFICSLNLSTFVVVSVLGINDERKIWCRYPHRYGNFWKNLPKPTALNRQYRKTKTAITILNSNIESWGTTKLWRTIKYLKQSYTK